MPVPFTTENSASFAIEGRPQLAEDPCPHGDLRLISPDYFATLRIYIPLFQRPLPAGYVLARADGDPSPLAGGIGDRVQSLGPQRPVHDLVTMESRVAA